MSGTTHQLIGLGSRRRFLKATGAWIAGASLARTSSAAFESEGPAASHPHAAASSPKEEGAGAIEIGILAGTFGRPTPEATLDAVKGCGLSCVQLNMACAGLSPMPDEIPSAHADRIRRAAADRQITIASLEGTFNMSHPDGEYRRTGLRRLNVLASACGQIGTSKIHICTGTRDRQNMWRRHAENGSPEAWRDMVACVREATEIAGKTGVVLAFEPEVNNVVDSAKKARRLLDEIGSPHLKVTMDAANLFHAGELARMREVLDQAFALVGKDIALAHAKDLSHDGDAGHEPAGHGRLDYDRYISLLNRYGYRGPLLLHGLSESQVPGCVTFLREKLSHMTADRAKRGHAPN